MSNELTVLQTEMSSSLIRHTKELTQETYSQFKEKVLPGIINEIMHLRDTGTVLGVEGIKLTKHAFSSSLKLATNLLPEAKPRFDGSIDNIWTAYTFGAVGIKGDKLSKPEQAILSKIEITIMNNSVTKNIPQIPKITERLLSILEKDCYPWTEFSHALNDDEKFQKQFISMANSPAFGLIVEAKTIEQLLLPLSKEALKQAILLTAFSHVMKFDKDKYGQEIRSKATETAFKTAIACKTLANDGYNLNETSAFMTGLSLHLGSITALRIMRQSGFELGGVYSRPFVKRLQQLVTLMSYRISLAWKLPKQTRMAIKEQAVLGQNPKLSPHGEALFLASNIAMAHYLSSNNIIVNSKHKVAAVIGLDRLAICKSSFDTLNNTQ